MDNNFNNLCNLRNLWTIINNPWNPRQNESFGLARQNESFGLARQNEFVGLARQNDFVGQV